MKLHDNYIKELKNYYEDHQKLPKDYDKGFFGRSTTETLIFSLPEDAVWIDDEYDENYENVIPPGNTYSVNWYSEDQHWRGGYFSKSNSIGKEFCMTISTRSYYFLGMDLYSNMDIPNDSNMSFEEFNDFFDDNHPDLGHYPPDCEFWTISVDFNINGFNPIKCVPVFQKNDDFELLQNDCINDMMEPFDGKDHNLHYRNTNIMNPYTGEYIPVWLVHKEISGAYFHNYKITDDNADEEFSFHIDNIKKYGKE